MSARDFLPPDGAWLARDGVWRSFATDPPAFPGEVVATRGAEDDAGEEQGEERAEEGIVAGADAWEQFGQVLPNEKDHEPTDPDPEVADIDEETFARWQLWVSEGGGS